MELGLATKHLLIRVLDPALISTSSLKPSRRFNVDCPTLNRICLADFTNPYSAVLTYVSKRSQGIVWADFSNGSTELNWSSKLARKKPI